MAQLVKKKIIMQLDRKLYLCIACVYSFDTSA